MIYNLLFLVALTLRLTEGLNFLAVGDWGGQETAPFYTSGQMASVQGMEKIAQVLKSQFVLGVGDNMYHYGVVDDSDPRFHQSFEDVYNTPSLQNKWYLIAGNHDYRGNVTAQISYSSQSSRWTFPSNYHSHQFRAVDGTSLDLIMIDTIDLAFVNTVVNPDEAGYFDPLPEQPFERGAKQWAWIEAQLKASRADHILVVGHYPVFSACAHGNTVTLVKHLRPLLQQYGAHYLSGHDHCMEHLAESDSSVNYFLSGMGAECCYYPIRKSGVPEGMLQWYVAKDNANASTEAGFTSFEVNKSGMTVKYYDQDGTTLHTVPTISARQLH